MHIVPDPILRQKAKKIRDITPSLQKLIDDMIDTMHEAGGVGLAANQVGVLQRVIVIQLPEDMTPVALINPEIILAEGERDVEEGCLSIPGYRGLVKRSVNVKVKAKDRNGKGLKITAQDLLAQAIEHEIDHLNGTLYIDRLVSRDKLWAIGLEEQATDEDSDDRILREGLG